MTLIGVITVVTYIGNWVVRERKTPSENAIRERVIRKCN